MRVLPRLLIGRMCHSQGRASGGKKPFVISALIISARLLGGLNKKQAEGGAHSVEAVYHFLLRLLLPELALALKNAAQIQSMLESGRGTSIFSWGK